MSDSALGHVSQLDHWTFLLALGLSAVETARTRRVRPALVTALLAVALVYDAYEFVASE